MLGYENLISALFRVFIPCVSELLFRCYLLFEAVIGSLMTTVGPLTTGTASLHMSSFSIAVGH